MRVGTTEALQNEVKRVVLSPDALAGSSRPAKLLDVGRRMEPGLAVTLDDAGPWIRKLQTDGVEFTVEDLSLDEIFEAFVIGQVELWPDQRANLKAVVR